MTFNDDPEDRDLERRIRSIADSPQPPVPGSVIRYAGEVTRHKRGSRKRFSPGFPSGRGPARLASVLGVAATLVVAVALAGVLISERSQQTGASSSSLPSTSATGSTKPTPSAAAVVVTQTPHESIPAGTPGPTLTSTNFETLGVATGWQGFSWTRLAANSPMLAGAGISQVIKWQGGYAATGPNSGNLALPSVGVWLSPDGQTWTFALGIGQPTVMIAVAPVGLVAIGIDASGTPQDLWTTSDGRTWSGSTGVSNLPGSLVSIAGTSTGIVATVAVTTGSGKFAPTNYLVEFSTDGANWSPETIQPGLTWNADAPAPTVQSNAGKFFLLGSTTSGGGRFGYKDDVGGYHGGVGDRDVSEALYDRRYRRRVGERTDQSDVDESGVGGSGYVQEISRPRRNVERLVCHKASLSTPTPRNTSKQKMNKLEQALNLSFEKSLDISDSIKELYESIPDLLELEERPTDLMLQVSDYLFFSMIDHYSHLCKRIRVTGFGTLTIAIAIYIYCATLSVLTPLDITVNTTPRIIELGLAYTLESECTLEELLNTFWLINVRLHSLCVHDRDTVLEIYEYLRSLIRRSFFFVGNQLEPKHIGLVSEALIAETTTEGGDIERILSAMAMRRIVETLCRLLCEIRVLLLPRSAIVPGVEYSNLTVNMGKSVTELNQAQTIRKELRDIVECSGVQPIDFPLFADQFKMEAYDPSIMTMLARVQSFSATQSVFINCVKIPELFSIKEYDPNYKMFTENERLAAQAIKLHAAERLLKNSGLNFRGDFVTFAPYIISTIDETLKDATPSLISLLGMYHVIFREEIIVCPLGVEQAIHVWNSIILNELDGRIDSAPAIGDAIRKMYAVSTNVGNESKWKRKLKY